MAKDLRDYQKQASEAKKPTTRPIQSGAARSSFEETTFGMNSGAGPNASRDVAPAAAKIKDKQLPMSGRTRRELGR